MQGLYTFPDWRLMDYAEAGSKESNMGVTTLSPSMQEGY